MANTQLAPHILIFDSGVGGLSITDAIMQQHPHASITYAADNAAFPYGAQSEVTLIERVAYVLHQLQNIAQADIIVVACNTASTIALPKIRERFELPIVGVVPAIKPAVALSESKTVGLLATPGTINSNYTQQLINDFAENCTIIKVGSNTLAGYAEKKLRGHPPEGKQLQTAIAAFANHPHLDTIALACTHFPLIKAELQSVLPTIKYWVDSGEAIARQIGYLSAKLSATTALISTTAPTDTTAPTNTPANTKTPQHQSIFTAKRDDISQLAPALKQRGLNAIRYLPMTTTYP